MTKINQTFEVSKKDWESTFFGFNFASLTLIEKISSIHFYDNYEGYKSELSSLLIEAEKEYNLIEANIDTSVSFVIPLLEDLGFRFVDSKISFFTLLNKENIQSQMFEQANTRIKIREKLESDFQEISDLAINFMVNDKAFVSKYKNKLFFESSLAEKYFREWVKNTFYAENSIISVAINEVNKVIGFFIYEKKKDIDGIPVYKGILTTVNPDYRGSDIHLSLQSFIFGKIGIKEFYIDNTTQLTNIPIIRNHIKSNRYLKNISFTFIKRRFS